MFAEHFGPAGMLGVASGGDTIAAGHNVFAHQAALFTAIHEDAASHAVIANAAQDMISVQHMTVADLFAHLSSFHLV